MSPNNSDQSNSNESDTKARDTGELEPLLQRFYDTYGPDSDDNPVQAFFAPGRVNLIGEYTDFTGGLVFPCAISQGTTLLIRRSSDQQYRFASTNFDTNATLAQNEIGRAIADSWVNYPLGVLDQFGQRGITLDGFDCLYSGNVPNGAGLSSSASIEVVTAFAVNTLLKANCDLLELVKMSQAAENDFVGMQCGIMDQFAVAMAQADHAMQLNCETLDYRQVPLNLGLNLNADSGLDDISILVTNTNQRRELNDSAYNQRVEECKRALVLLQSVLPIENLGQLLTSQLTTHESIFSTDPIALKRARHICHENERVRAAVPALESGNLAQFATLMNQSHNSLRDLFEVSSDPLNHLVELARAQPTVLGSRLTGAGFGGCTVTMLPTKDIEQFKASVSSGYTTATGLNPTFYTISVGDGVRQLQLPDSGRGAN